MTAFFIREQDFDDFVKKLVQSKKTYAPVAKKTKYVFAELNDPGKLRLDYDVTILPPKKLFFPTEQNIVKFEENKYEACVNPEEQVLLGVHFYDVKAIDMTDYLFTENNEDINYTAYRNATTIVASNVQNVSERAFWASVGKEVSPKGHDAFLTKIKGGYVYESITPKGDALTSLGKFEKASDAQVKEAEKVNNAVMDKCPEALKFGSKEIAEKVRGAFGKEDLWEKLAEDCFSCGSCNVICPTCYCFDIEDKWNVDQKSGVRTRYWDACLTGEFAKVTLGEGGTENFRETRGSRFRHRIMRKAAYLNEKLGGPACVGCGRCSTACTADIADPVNVIHEVMEA
jgi:formate hydrogenlyase subunit 6/NADH:ubiquinone oxidoreductase subunit I